MPSETETQSPRTVNGDLGEAALSLKRGDLVVVERQVKLGTFPTDEDGRALWVDVCRKIAKDSPDERNKLRAVSIGAILEGHNLNVAEFVDKRARLDAGQATENNRITIVVESDAGGDDGGNRRPA